MPRYIDADVLLRELAYYADRPTKRAMACVKDHAFTPDPDVVKVVRCKDCKYCDEYSTCWWWNDKDGEHVRSDDFCVRGERR